MRTVYNCRRCLASLMENNEHTPEDCLAGVEIRVTVAREHLLALIAERDRMAAAVRSHGLAVVAERTNGGTSRGVVE